MKGVGAALHRDRCHGTAAEPDFRRVSVGLDLELLDRLDRGNEVRDVNPRILRVHAVERHSLVDLTLTVGAHRVAGTRNREPALAVGQAGPVAILHTRNHNGQCNDVASVERKFNHALVLDHAADDGVFGVESNGGRGNLNGLGHVADFE